MSVREALCIAEIMQTARATSIEKIAAFAYLKKLKKGDYLFRDKEEVTTIYVVIDGMVTLYKGNTNGEKKVVFVFGKGKAINEVIVNGLPASINCECFTDVQILCLPLKQLLEVMEEDFGLTKAILDSMSLKIRRLYRQLKNTSNSIRIDKKLAAKLIKLATDYGVECEDGLKIDLDITITYLADMLGSKRETVSRQLKVLTDAKLVIFKEGNFIIPNTVELRRYFKESWFLSRKITSDFVIIITILKIILLCQIMKGGSYFMFFEEFSSLINAAKSKIQFLKDNPFGYFLSSMLAGAYVGFGILLIFTIGGLLDGAPYTKILMGASFGVALSLVIMAGSELFTGINLVIGGGLFSKTISFKSALKVLIICFIGNWLGSILLAYGFYGAGLAVGPVGAFISKIAAVKMHIPFTQLLIRGILCNVLVCLAVWISFRLKSESGKLIMIFWCLFAFITSGFEHSIANMTLLTISLLAPLHDGITLSGYFYNILVVTIGNMIGALLFLAFPYFIISKKKAV